MSIMKKPGETDKTKRFPVLDCIGVVVVLIVGVLLFLECIKVLLLPHSAARVVFAYHHGGQTPPITPWSSQSLAYLC